MHSQDPNDTREMLPLSRSLLRDLLGSSAVSAADWALADEPLHLGDLGDVDLLLPSRLHTLRQLVDDAFASIGVTPNIRA